MKSSTSSVRFSNDLRGRLDEAAQRLKIGKNTIITQALEQYLNKLNRTNFLAEARRQSMLANALQRRRRMSGWTTAIHPGGNSRTGLEAASQIMIDKIMAIKRERIAKVIGRACAERLREVDDALRIWLHLD